MESLRSQDMTNRRSSFTINLLVIYEVPNLQEIVLVLSIAQNEPSNSNTTDEHSTGGMQIPCRQPQQVQDRGYW